MKAYGEMDVDTFLDLDTSWRMGQLYASVALSLGKAPSVSIE
jgi:hypothetical protein